MQTITLGKSAEIRSRIEPDLKQQSAEVLANLGLDLSAAIRLFLRQVVEVGGLPFEVRKQPTPETITAMMEARAMTAARNGTAQELFDELDKKASKGKTRVTTKKIQSNPPI
jgi:DNA-damage-inducible protein J